MEFRLLGSFEVVTGERVLDIGSPKQRSVLAMLTLHLNRVVPLEALVEELWAEEPPASAIPTVQNLVSRLRRILLEASDGPEEIAVRAREPGYVLEANPALVDAHRFECLSSRGRDALNRGDPRTAAETLADGLALWRGPALAGLADRNFARLEATRLDEARVAAVEELAEADLALGRPADALARLEVHVAAHPLRERAWGHFMLALYRLGRQAEALRAYQRVRHLLIDELGVEPTPRLRGLEEDILHQRPELDWQPPLQVAPARDESPAEIVAPRSAADTVVFLFTDIEASTRRWEGHQEGMGRDLARHDALLRAAIEDGQGRVFSHTGDGLGAVFPTATAALTAAVAGQQALLQQQWHDTRPLRVRMALHAGTAERHGDTYVGPTLNRVARLLSIANGGQVLCSQPVADLTRDDVPAQVTLLDLGEHALADLARPEHVFQLVHPDLPSAFAPLRSHGARRHNLPVALTPFVGRESELEELDELLGSVRHLTLIGVGGAGKTRLAIETAARAMEAFPDGVWLAELGPLRDPSGLVSEVTAAVGLEGGGAPGDPAAAEAHLCDQLRARQLLLVLDNCEHVVEAVARLVHTILARCPAVTVLATSREVLGLPGEVVWGVPPLSLPPPDPAGPEDLAGSDAVTLFCERASRAGFGLTSANCAAVAQICRRLDGIPLALELAAARIHILGAHQVAARLDDRFRLLTGGARTAVARHQTLGAAMDWSHQLLPPAEQAALRRLSVFPDSFDLEAAEAVVRPRSDDDVAEEPGFEVLDLLGRLVDKSLLTVQNDGHDVRYRLLETVRQYAAERLAEASETAETHRRHRDLFLGMAAEWVADVWWENGFWANRLVLDYSSFRAALEYSLAEGDEDAALHLAAICWYYWLWGGRREGVELLERALAGPARPVTPVRAEALIGLGALLSISGSPDFERSSESLNEAADVALRLSDAAILARARYFIGEIAIYRRDVDRAREEYESALQWSEANHARVMSGWCHHCLGWVAVAAGDASGARAHFERGLELVGQRIDVLTPHVLGSLAIVVAADGDAARAVSLAEGAVAAARQFLLRGILLMALTRAAETALLCGAESHARAWTQELVGLLRELGTRRWVADALEMVALVHEGDGQDKSAVRLLGASNAAREASGQSPGGIHLLAPRVRACRDRLVEALGPDGFAEQDAAGRAMSAEEALAGALAL